MLGGRASIAAAGFSCKWQHALRSKLHPPGRDSMRAAALIYHKVPTTRCSKRAPHPRQAALAKTTGVIGRSCVSVNWPSRPRRTSNRAPPVKRGALLLVIKQPLQHRLSQTTIGNCGIGSPSTKSIVTLARLTNVKSDERSGGKLTQRMAHAAGLSAASPANRSLA